MFNDQEFENVCPKCGSAIGNICPVSAEVYYPCCGFSENTEVLDD